jgi:hypothetical protein
MKGNTMSNQPQQGTNEAPKTPTPNETKPAPQQNQGDGKRFHRNPISEANNAPYWVEEARQIAGLFCGDEPERPKRAA